MTLTNEKEIIIEGVLVKVVITDRISNCNSYVGYLKLKDSYELILKNVREDKNIDSKFDINNGFIVNFKDNFFFSYIFWNFFITVIIF